MTELGQWRLNAGDLPSAMAARRSFERLLRDVALPDSDVSGSELIFGELVANGLEHGAGTVTLALSIVAGELVLSVRDEGGWAFRSVGSEAPPPTQLRGRGLFFVQSMARRIAQSEHGRATQIVLPVTVREHWH